MQYEVEQKYRVDSPADVDNSLRRLGAELPAAIEQVDQYYAHPDRDFAVTDEALRLRLIGQTNFVTYKGPKIDALTKTRREIEVPLAPGARAAEDFDQVLQALGFRPVAKVCKQRRHAELLWQGLAVDVSLDSVGGLGDFVELELLADEAGLDSARQCLAALSAELGLTRTERRSYLELLLEG
jgi:adenylate cyclase class 2